MLSASKTESQFTSNNAFEHYWMRTINDSNLAIPQWFSLKTTGELMFAFLSFPSPITSLSTYFSCFLNITMLTPSVKISPCMVVSTVYPWLERYACNEVTLSHVLHHINFELGAVKAHFDEDHWMDILEHITTRPNGWDEVKAEWLRVKSGMWHFLKEHQCPYILCKFHCFKIREPGVWSRPGYTEGRT